MENHLSNTALALLIMTGLDPVIFYPVQKMAVSSTAMMRIGRARA